MSATSMAPTVTPRDRRGVRRRRIATRFYAVIPYLASFAALLLVWMFAADVILRSALFPSPVSVFAEGFRLLADGTLLENAGSSVGRILIGFLLGCAIGVPMGLLVGSFTLARKLIEPWTEFFRFVPATAMITVAVIWFGIGEESKVFLIAYSTVFIVVLNTAAGVGAIAPNKIRAARVLGANDRQVFFWVALPATVPFILTGMRIAMANAFTTIVAAEMVSAQSGLGVMIWSGRMFMLVDQIFVALVTLGLLGFAADRLFRFGIYRFARRYSPVI